MTNPISRRSFAAGLSAFAAAVAARLGFAATTTKPVPLVRPVWPKPDFPPLVDSESLRSLPWTTDGAFTQAPASLPLSRDELAAELEHHYNRWWSLLPQTRTASALIGRVQPLLNGQWKLRHGERALPDFGLFAERERTDAALLTAQTPTLHNDLFRFGPIDESPLMGPGVPKGEPTITAMRLREFRMHHRCIDGQVGDYHSTPNELIKTRVAWGIAANWEEGTPAQRFGLGLALLFEELVGSVSAVGAVLPGPGVVGDLHLTIDVKSFRPTPPNYGSADMPAPSLAATLGAAYLVPRLEVAGFDPATPGGDRTVLAFRRTGDVEGGNPCGEIFLDPPL